MDEIGEYTLAQFGMEQVLKMETILFAAFHRLADFPGIGHPRIDLTKRPFLFFPNDPYLIAYEQQQDGILIHGILHASRNLRRLLKQRPF